VSAFVELVVVDELQAIVVFVSQQSVMWSSTSSRVSPSALPSKTRAMSW
jgi:hypothetical protein